MTATDHDHALFIQTVPAHEVLDSICSFLPDGIPHEVIKLAVVMATAGHVVYIPKNLVNEMRNRQMIAEFDGMNALELCARYGITKQHFYRVLKRSRQKKVTCFGIKGY